MHTESTQIRTHADRSRGNRQTSARHTKLIFPQALMGGKMSCLTRHHVRRRHGASLTTYEEIGGRARAARPSPILVYMRTTSS